MGRNPNHRFSVTRNRTITPFESVLDSIKRMPHQFLRATKRQVSLQKTPTAYHMGGNKSKKRQNNIDLRERDRGRNRDRTSADPNNRHDDESSEGRESLDSQADLEFNPYLAIVEDLTTKLKASQAATETALTFYTKHQAEIQEVDTTRQQLSEMTKRCNDYRIAIKSLREFEGEKEQELDKRMAAIDEDRREIDVGKEKVARERQQFVEEQHEFEDMRRRKEAEQVLKLQEEKEKLEREHQKQYAKRIEDFEKEIKKSQDDDRKKISDLQTKNDELMKVLEEQRLKLKDAEKKSKDTEKLRSISEKEAEELSQKLKMAENEFGLRANSTEYFRSKFLKMHNDVRTIALRYVEQIKVEDLDTAIHDQIEEVDDDFISVPISNSIVSKELRLAHFQRIISSQLQAILWQPFSSEQIVQDPKPTLLFNQIYDKLAKSSHEGRSGFRAARTFAALTARSLHSQSTSTKRVEIFTENVMKVLSLLLSPKIHPALRKDLTILATSAISLWETVQMDESELQVHPSLDPASFPKPEEEIAVTGRVFVLFPRVTARNCARTGNAYPVGLPGGWVDSKPEAQFEEVCIYEGEGLPEWEQLVRAGEDEEEDRRMKQEIESKEKKKRELEEEMEKLNKPDVIHRRGSSYSRRSSMAVGKSTSSNPTSAWLGRQKMPEKE